MPKKLINVSNFSGGLNKNTNSRDMIADEYQVMLNLNNEIPGKLTMYGSPVVDAKNVANATAITSINHGNGLFHFNLDRDISTPTVVSNTEYLAINDIANKKVRVIDYTDSTNSDATNPSTDISTDIVYATTGSHEVLMYMADGGLRVVPKPSADNSIYPSILYYQDQTFNFGDLDPDFLAQEFSTFKVHKLHIGGITGSIGASYATKDNNLDPDRLYRQNIVFKPTYGSEFFVDNVMIKTNIVAQNATNDAANGNTYNFGRDQMDSLFASIPGNVYQYSSPINVDGRVGAMTMVSYFSNRSDAGFNEDSNITVYKDSDNKRYGLWVAPMYEKNTYEAPAYFMNTIPQPNTSVTTEVKRKLFFGLYGRPPAASRISGYKIYWGLITNYQESVSPQIYDEGSVSAKYCFAEVDFTRGIRYAGEDTYSAFTEDLSKTTTVGSSEHKFYNWCFPVDAYDTSADHFKGQAFSDLLTVEPYIHKTPSLIGPDGTGFKTVTIANRKAYIGNVKYYDKEGNLIEKNDRILKSLPNQFDYFEEDNFIDVEVEDGDDIIKLASLGQRLLEFKKRVLYIINVSRNIEYLEGTYAFKGCEKDYHVYEGEGFIAWINPNGVFFYDGQQLTDISLNESGQSVFSSNSFYDDDHVIGYLPKTKELYIANKDNTILKYDLKSQSWTEGDDFGVVNGNNNFTNFILKNDESLTYYQALPGFNNAPGTIQLRNWNPTPVSFTGSNKTIFKTKEFDFGNPTANKNINTIYVNYKNGQNITVKGFGTKRDASAVALTDIGVLVNTSGGFRTTKLAVPATFKDLVSFGIALELDGASAADFELNDLQIVYRDKVFR